MEQSSGMERFDSASIFSIFKNEDGENLLPFDEMAAILEMGDLGVPMDVPLITTTAPLVTTEAPFKNPFTEGHVLQNLPSTSGGAESAHTRALAGPEGSSSSDGDMGSDGDGSDLDGQQITGQRALPDDGQPTSSTYIAGEANSGAQEQERPQELTRDGGGRGFKATSGVKKRRQRNADQMESNRVAQQKYRQRKKQEQSTLQQAVDLLTAQVATLKAVEVRAGELEAANFSLQETVRRQGASIVALQQHNATQVAQLQATRAALHSSQSQVVAQNKIILDQQAKLRLQEEVITSLKDRLKERIDEAMQHVVPGTVCEKMVAAVKATLYDAKDVHGLQETLGQLPENLVNELCKNIFHVCKETWPEMRARCSQHLGGPSCMTGAA